MKAKDLIAILESDPEAEVLVQVKVTREENGYKHAVNEWVPIEERHVMKPPFGGRQIFLGAY